MYNNAQQIQRAPNSLPQGYNGPQQQQFAPNALQGPPGPRNFTGPQSNQAINPGSAPPGSFPQISNNSWVAPGGQQWVSGVPPPQAMSSQRGGAQGDAQRGGAQGDAPSQRDNYQVCGYKITLDIKNIY